MKATTTPATTTPATTTPPTSAMTTDTTASWAPARSAAGRELPAHRRLQRRRSGRLVAGVATGLAAHLGVPVLWVRVVLVALTLAGGSGAVAYAVFWVVLPQAEAEQGAPPQDTGRWQVVAFSAVSAVGLLVLHDLGLDSPAVLPLVAAAVGVALVWRQSDDAQRAGWRASATGAPGRRWPVVVGAALLAAGLAGFLASRGELRAARDGLLSTVVVVGGLVLLGLPWVVRTSTDLRAERRERIRASERAELAAQVHDSVLQTLALIQKAADDPREVGRLARSQERELRGWLYGPATSALTFAAGLERAAAEVEEAYGVPVEVVVVGDAPRDERLSALTSAAREAVVNASKHAGAPLVRVYAEVEPDHVTVYVRDRGCGFDVAAVPADRFGLAESVVGRVERAGGEARVRSAPGEGTEIRLQVPRA